MALSKRQSILFWGISLILTVSIIFYQRITGPTYPVSGSVKIENWEIDFEFPRSHPGEGDQIIAFELSENDLDAYISYRRYKSHDDWTTQKMQPSDDGKVAAALPHQPPAGKIMYDVYILKDGREIHFTEEPVIIRFRGDVPVWIVIPHVLLIFLSIFFSLRAFFEALYRGDKIYSLSKWTVIILLVGGMIFGPLMQYYAFDAFWTGWPLGHDLTDNKTAVGFLFWVIALWRLRKAPLERRGWAIAATIVLLAVFLVPHSVLGSEIDYTQMPDAQ